MLSSKGIFIVFEGPDGVGKSTQARLFRRFLKKNNIKHRYIHFPQYKKKPFGDLISRYLRGEFGKADEVNPYLASLLYAGDRQVCSKTLRRWIDDGYIVVADRYILSNIAFQRAKIRDKAEKLEFTDWIQNFEYKHNRIVKPDVTIFLDADDDFIVSRLTENRGCRTYLRDCEDIHEKDIEYQKRVIMEYRDLSKSMKGILHIRCYDKEGMMLPPNEIHNNIVRCLQKRFQNLFIHTL